MPSSPAKRKRKLRAEKKEPQEAVFEVEKVLESKTDETGKKFFLIKWLGYPDEDNTWEPEENCNCPKLIKKFVKKARKQAKRKRILSSDHSESDESNTAVDKSALICKSRANITSTPTAVEELEQPGTCDVYEFNEPPERYVMKISTRSINNHNEPQCISLLESHDEHTCSTPNDECLEGRKKRDKQLLYGWDKGLDAECILGASNEYNGGLHYLVKWKGPSSADLLPADECELFIPDLVCDFLESKLL